MQSGKRARCDTCGFLADQCVCKWVPELSTRLKVLILQDPKESKHAKNTVPLLSLGLPSVKCITTENKGELVRVLTLLDPAKWCLVFPADNASFIESMDANSRAEIEGLILIDATWRKAKKLYFTESILYSFGAISFAQPPKGQYAIRKSPNMASLSTLEACAYAIEQVAGESMQPLRDFMHLAQEWQWRKQPLNHKHLD